MKHIAVLVVLAGLFLWFFVADLPVEHGPGVFAPEPPHQELIQPAQPFPFEDYVIYRLAHFETTARVLSTESYFFGQDARLSPIDLALGWGRMSDESVLKYFSITQGGRWYRWRYKELPIPADEVIRSSANMHMVPADSYVRKRLKRIRKGEIVKIKGYLVAIEGYDGFHWRSSLTRTDTGDGACELVYVEDVEVVERPESEVRESGSPGVRESGSSGF